VGTILGWIAQSSYHPFNGIRYTWDRLLITVPRRRTNLQQTYKISTTANI
jgi:hypothetical protein